MNEPHDLISVATWADTLQQAVTAIRNFGAENYLLLPGSSWSSAEAFPTEAGPLLVNITNPDGGNDRLIFDGELPYDVCKNLRQARVYSAQVPRRR